VVYDQGKEGRIPITKAGDDVLTISLERALELLAEPKKGVARGSKSKQAYENWVLTQLMESQ